MNSASKDYILKFFSGPHIGAEVLLKQGAYTLGRDPECDIVLHDEALAPRTVRLTISPDGVTVLPLEQAVSIDGNKIEGDALVAFHQVIGLATTYFAIVPQGEVWKAIQLPSVATYSEPDQVSKNDSKDAIEIADKEDTNNSNPLAVPDPDSIGESAAVTTDLSIRHKRYELLSWGGIGVLLLAVFIFFLYGHIGAASKEQLHVNGFDQALNSEQQVTALLQQLSLPNVSVERLENGRLKVQGYVADAPTKKRLLVKLRDTNARIQTNVWTPDELVASGREVLHGLGLPLEVNYGSTKQQPGTLVLQGHVTNQAKLNRALKLLHRDIPGLKKLENHVMITTTSQKPPHQSTDAGSVSGLPQLEIRSASFRPVPYIVTRNGSKYLLGAKLSGYIIEAIYEDRVILSRDGQQFIHYFGRG